MDSQRMQYRIVQNAYTGSYEIIPPSGSKLVCFRCELKARAFLDDLLTYLSERHSQSRVAA